MNPIAHLLSACLLSAAGAAFAASGAAAADPRPPESDLPPPPGLHDPGVNGASAPAAPAAVAPAATEDPLAPLPKPDARLVRDRASRDASATAQRVSASQITTRKQGSDTVEEYRERGHVWMIRIVPQNGPTQTFMDSDGSGRLVRDPREGPISPVYYTLYEWK